MTYVSRALLSGGVMMLSIYRAEFKWGWVDGGGGGGGGCSWNGNIWRLSLFYLFLLWNCSISSNFSVRSGLGGWDVSSFQQHSHFHQLFFTHPSIPSHMHCCKYLSFFNHSKVWVRMLTGSWVDKVHCFSFAHIFFCEVCINLTFLQAPLCYNLLAGFKSAMSYHGVSSCRRTQRTIRKGDGRQTVKSVRWEVLICCVSVD